MAWTTIKPDDNTLMAFKVMYPQKGKQWCMDNLFLTDAQVRHYAGFFALKSSFRNNPDANFRRGSAFRGKKRPEHSAWLKENHHMLGKKHSIATRKKIALKTILQMKGRNAYSRSKQGYYKIGKRKMYFRSTWEANYALYLDFLIQKNQIQKWEYEKDTFWFDKIKRGVRSYTPDFKVFSPDSSFEYHEVKGWMDSKSKTKIKRMAKYYPQTKLLVIDSKLYRAMIKAMNNIVSFY